MNPWVRAACGRDPLRSMRETRGGNFRATEEAPDGDPSRVRCAPGADHVRCAEHRNGRGPARPVPGRSGGGRRVGWAVRRRARAGRGGGVHGLVVRVRGAGGCRCDGAPGRAGGGERVAAQETSRQDRSRRCALAADAARRGPEAWIPPAHVREWRTQTRLRKTLIDERTCWLQRIQATLFHHGIVNVPDQLLRANGRAFLRELVLPPAALQRIEVALAIIDEFDRQLVVLERDLARLARRQIGCQALMRQYGVGPITATTVLCELGDVTRLSASRKAVRCSGLDIGVYRSDRRSRTGRITRQGSPALRWALYEAAQAACKPASPDHADYVALKARGLSHTRASLTIARKLARRSFHILRELGPDALAPIS